LPRTTSEEREGAQSLSCFMPIGVSIPLVMKCKRLQARKNGGNTLSLLYSLHSQVFRPMAAVLQQHFGTIIGIDAPGEYVWDAGILRLTLLCEYNIHSYAAKINCITSKPYGVSSHNNDFGQHQCLTLAIHAGQGDSPSWNFDEQAKGSAANLAEQVYKCICALGLRGG